MLATMMYGAGDVRIENVPDAQIVDPTDALVRVTRACICGSDLWPYKDLKPDDPPRVMGHEAIGVVEDVGADVSGIGKGDFVIMPFAFSDGTCEFCQEGLNTSCIHGGFFGNPQVAGAQAEAVRVPQADGTLYSVGGSEDTALLASLLTLSDVMGTGYHATLMAAVEEGDRVAVVGDGAVGLCGVIAANLLGAEQIIIMGRHPQRLELAKDYGATDVVSERGEEAVTQRSARMRAHVLLLVHEHEKWQHHERHDDDRQRGRDQRHAQRVETVYRDRHGEQKHERKRRHEAAHITPLLVDAPRPAEGLSQNVAGVERDLHRRPEAADAE